MQNETKSQGDIPSRIVREQGMKDDEIAQHRYTLTYSEGTLSNAL